LLLENLTNRLKSSFCDRIFWASKQFEGQTNEIEPWYGTAFSVEKIKDDLVKVGKIVIKFSSLMSFQLKYLTSLSFSVFLVLIEKKAKETGLHLFLILTLSLLHGK